MFPQIYIFCFYLHVHFSKVNLIVLVVSILVMAIVSAMGFSFCSFSTGHLQSLQWLTFMFNYPKKEAGPQLAVVPERRH